MLLPSLVFSLIAACALWITLRKNPAGNPRASGLVLTLLLILPILGFVPKYSVTVSDSVSQDPPSLLIPYLWLAGFALFSLKGLRDLLAIQKWRRQSLPAPDLTLFHETLEQLKVRQKVSLQLHPRLNSPVVAGILRPTVYLPKSSSQWSPETLRMAVLHELGHIQRRDLWMASLAHLACLLHWFNPAVWWLRRTFLAQCEFACDAHLVQHGANPQTYAHALCDVAQSAAAPPLSLAMAGHVPLRERIICLSERQKRSSVFLSSLILLTAASATAASLVRFVPRLDIAPSLPKEAIEENQLRFQANPFPED